MASEYVVRVPRDVKKQFNVMRFPDAVNIDVSKLKHCKMERENLFKEVKEEIEEEEPEFGAGSEYGRKEREEAKRRRFEKRKNKQNNSPWILKVGGKQGKKYRGLREGGVSQNTSYYVFFQAPDGAFEAFPVNEWYKFSPFQRYKALSAEEAEEKFNKRDQILNYFPLKLMNKKQGEGSLDEPNKKSERSVKKEFKVSDMDDWDQSDNDNLSENENSEDEDRNSKVKDKLNKGKKEKKDKRKKKSDSDDDDEEPMEDSDEGDYDDKEVDYMSDSSSSAESEMESSDIKGVIDESALRELVVSDEEEEEENKEQKTEQTDETKPNELEKKVKVKSEKNPNDSSVSDSDFDSENSDLDDSKSALLIQNRKGQKAKKEEQESNSEVKLASGSSNVESSKNANHSNGLKFKHKLDSSENTQINNKRPKIEKVKNEHSDGITEDAVRRYLMRKPMTCTDLLQKFKNKVHQRDNLVSIIADILKKLNPETQKIKGKMYFSLKPT